MTITVMAVKVIAPSRPMKKIVCFIIASIFIFQSTLAQDAVENRAIAVNNYVLFSNESAHGMLIIHRLLELYNQELNKFVDLPGYSLNLFSNSDFPENIFLDKSGSFYRVSPYDLYERALEGSRFLPPPTAKKANAIIGEMRMILDELEKERYAIGTLIAHTDKSSMENLRNVYNALDACVDQYDDFQTKRAQLAELLQTVPIEMGRNDKLNKSFVEPYNKFATTMHATFTVLRTENEAAGQAAVRKLITDAEKLSAALDKQGGDFSNQQLNVIKEMKTIMDKHLSILREFIVSPKLPEEYELYGASYYMYNVLMAGTTNKYGTGIIERGNEWLKINGRKYIYQFERPHYYKVIRPKDIIEQTTAEVIAPPVEVDDRKIVVDKSKVISSNTEKLMIEVFDHEEFDHDTISLQFNGQWILKKQLITKEPIRLYLTLEKGKDNYLVLFADNLGTRPPNTCAIRYLNENGKYNLVVLRSDFNESEMIILRRD